MGRVRTFSTQGKPLTTHVYDELQELEGGNISQAFPDGAVAKKLPAKAEMQETWVRFLAYEDSLDEKMATHSSILA